MKKSLLSFLILVLCISVSPTKIFAQEVGGGSSDGYFDVSTGLPIADININPPSYALNVTRNNGNGTTKNGVAQVRLHVTGQGFSGNTILKGIAWKNNEGLKYPVVNAGGTEPEKWAKNYLSFPLVHNIPPKGKLVFNFEIDGVSYWIPEM